MAAGLFDVLKDLFEGKELSNKYSDQELKSLGFSIQRIMSIKYPLQAQSQNVLSVNFLSVVKYWATNMKGKFVELPRWTMVATAAKRKEYQAKLGMMELPEKEVLNAFMEFHGLDKHELQFLVKHKSKELSEMLTKFEEIYEA